MAPEKLEHVNLQTVARGAAPEVFDHLFGKILENIRDPNTDPTATRTLTLQFVVKPVGEDRDEARVVLKPNLKLPTPCKPIGGVLFIGRDRATTRDVRQEDLLESNPDVHPIRDHGTS